LNSRNDRVVSIEDEIDRRERKSISDRIRTNLSKECIKNDIKFSDFDKKWELFNGDVLGWCDAVFNGRVWIPRVVDPKHFDSQLAPDWIVYATITQYALDLTDTPAVVSTICRETHQYRDEELPFNCEAMRFAERQVARWRKSKLDPIASHENSFLCRECQWKELCHG
jgi:hypothetical protein